MSFSEDIDRAVKLLRLRGRASVRAIALELGADEDYAKSIRDEIVDVLQLASDDGKGILTALTPDGGKFRPQEDPAALQSKADRAAERRLVTFLFCDVVSSTPLSMRLDPEDLRTLMLNYQNACGRAVERFEGHISQWVGDGAFMYFGFPEAHDDDAVRAIHAAHAMVEAVAGLAAARDGTKLEIRVGVHTGWAVVGDLGKGKNETLAFGEAPNICARIQACAAPNTVAVSDSTFALAQGFFAFSDHGEFDLKGVDRAVRLYRAGAATGAGVRFDVMRDQGLLPLVNRDRERHLVSAGWRACLVSDGPALLIEGEAGIGKSRIVHFAKELVAESGQILEIFASPYQRWSSSRAVSHGLRKFLGLDKVAEADQLNAIAQRLETLQLEDALALSLLADFLGAKRPEMPELKKLEPPQIRSMTFETIGKLVQKISAAAPLLVVVEDMHWLDPSSEELVRLLLGRRDGARMFFLMTARSEYLQSTDQFAGVERHAIEGLPPEESIALARLAMARDPRVGELADRIATRSGGNPLFIEELTRAIPFVGAGPGGKQAEIPYTLQSTLRARLDSVEVGARDIAEWAAVIGNGFDRTLLEAASGLDPGVIFGGLESLVRAQLLRRVPSAPGERYEFRHALQQEAAAEGMLRSVARARHLAVANALLGKFPSIGRTEPEIVARHFGEAGEAEQELHYRTLAAERAVSLGAYREAVVEIDRCLVLVNAMPPGLARDQSELRARLAQGGVYLATKGQGSVEAKDAFDLAFALTQRLPPSPEGARALFGLWTYYLFRGDARTAVILATDMLASAEGIGAAEPQMVAHFACSASHQMVGQLAACVSHADLVLKLYDPAESEGYIVRYAQDPRVTVMTNACVALTLQGRVDEARQASAETVLHARHLGHEFVLSIALQIPAFLAVHTGDAEAALPAALEWMAVAERQENPVYPALAASVISWARAKGGDRDGLLQLRGIREGFLAQGVALADAMFVSMLADAALALGDLGQGQEILASFDGAARGALTYEAEHRRLKALLSLAGGASPADIRPQLESAFALANEQGAGILALRAALSLAEVMEDLGDAEGARAMVLQAQSAVEGDCMDKRAADRWLARKTEANEQGARS